MDPNSGQLYSGTALDALKDQSDNFPQDKPLKRKLKRMIPLTDDEHRDLSGMNIRERKGWAKARNERKRARQWR